MNKPAMYIIALIVMFGFLLLSPYKGIILIVIIGFIVFTLVRFLYWRNKYDY